MVDKLNSEIKKFESEIEGKFGKNLENYINSLKLDLKALRDLFRSQTGDQNKKNFIENANVKLPEFAKKLETISEKESDLQVKLALLRSKADILRYLIEFNEETDYKSQYVQETLISYREALELCNGLPATNYHYLAINLNYSVLLADEMREVDEAILISKDILSKIEGLELSEDTLVIKKLIIQNLDYFIANREKYFNEEKIIY